MRIHTFWTVLGIACIFSACSLSTLGLSVSDAWLLEDGNVAWSVDPDLPIGLELTFYTNPSNFDIYIHSSQVSYQSSDDIDNHYTFSWSSSQGFHEVGPDFGGYHLVQSLCDDWSNSTARVLTLGFRLGKVAETGNWVVTLKDQSSQARKILGFKVTQYFEVSFDQEIRFSGKPGETVPSDLNPFNIFYTSNCEIDLVLDADDNPLFTRFTVDDDGNLDESVETWGPQRNVGRNVRVALNCPIGSNKVKRLYFHVQLSKPLLDNQRFSQLTFYALSSNSLPVDSISPSVGSVDVLDAYLNTGDDECTLRAQVSDDKSLGKVVFGVLSSAGRYSQALDDLVNSASERVDVDLSGSVDATLICRVWDSSGNSRSRTSSVHLYQGPVPGPGSGKYFGVTIYEQSGFKGRETAIWWDDMMQKLAPSVMYWNTVFPFFVPGDEFKKPIVFEEVNEVGNRCYQDGVWYIVRVGNSEMVEIGLGQVFQNALEDMMMYLDHPPLYVFFGTEWGSIDPSDYSAIPANVAACDSIVKQYGCKGFGLQIIVGKDYVPYWPIDKIFGRATNYPHFDGSMPPNYEQTIQWLDKEPNGFVMSPGYIARGVEDKWTTDTVRIMFEQADLTDNMGVLAPCILNLERNMLDDNVVMTAMRTQAANRGYIQWS